MKLTVNENESGTFHWVLRENDVADLCGTDPGKLLEQGSGYVTSAAALAAGRQAAATVTYERRPLFSEVYDV